MILTVYYTLTGNCVQNNSLSCEARRSCLLSSVPKWIIELQTAHASRNILTATITRRVLRIKYIPLKSIIQLPMFRVFQVIFCSVKKTFFQKSRIASLYML